jgi:hypothetical protein
LSPLLGFPFYPHGHAQNGPIFNTYLVRRALLCTLLVSNKPIRGCSFRHEVKEPPLEKKLLNEAQLRSMYYGRGPFHFLHNHGRPHRVGCLQLGGNRFYQRLFQSGFPHLWLTGPVCSSSCIQRLQVNPTTSKLEPADGHLSHCDKAWQSAWDVTPKLFTYSHTPFLVSSWVAQWSSAGSSCASAGSTWNVKQRWETL